MFFKPPPHVGSSSTAPVLVHEGHPSAHVPHRGGVEEDPGVDPKVAGEPIERKMKALFSDMLNFVAQ